VALEQSGVLCFQQSAGNSASPEIDLSSPFLRDGVLDRDVSDLDSAAGP
jgi:hypothetical protein